ncbi:MAG: HAD family phosphatase [Terrabacter sp.]|nr:HAD family phosphatase [Terrabacter sp.]
MTTVVFDLGGVVVQWDPVPAIAAVVGHERAQHFVHGGEFDFAEWNHQQDAGRTFAEAEQVATASHPHFAEEIAAYRPNFALSLRGLVPGTDGLVRELHERGTRLVALTNWPAETFHHALELYPDVFARFDDIVVSGVEGIAKPDPAIFRVLETRLGHPLDGIVYVDDAVANVEAARAAGLDALQFTSAEALRDDLTRRGLLG